MTSPATTFVFGVADFVVVSSGVWVAVTVALAVSVTGAPPVSRADTVAVLWMLPASTSAWVTVYVALQSIVSPGASVAGAVGVQSIAERPVIGSVTWVLWSVTVPVFCTANE